MTNRLTAHRSSGRRATPASRPCLATGSSPRWGRGWPRSRVSGADGARCVSFTCRPPRSWRHRRRQNQTSHPRSAQVAPARTLGVAQPAREPLVAGSSRGPRRQWWLGVLAAGVVAIAHLPRRTARHVRDRIASGRRHVASYSGGAGATTGDEGLTESRSGGTHGDGSRVPYTVAEPGSCGGQASDIDSRWRRQRRNGGQAAASSPNGKS